MRITPAIACLAFGLILLGFLRTGGEDRSPEKDDAAWVKKTLAEMTLEEKVGQLIVPYLSAVFMNPESDQFREIERAITRYHVGGYHAFSGDPSALALLLNRMQKLAKVPLLITADLEGGPGYQFRGATRVPRAMALGATGSEELAYEAGKITALEGRAMGIGVNFYPVADVNNNPRNPIINIRSFGEDPAQVSRLVRAYIRGAQENGQLATAKHFPGHGDTGQDSHIELPVITASRERLEQVELPPFRAAVEAGVAAMMTAHIYLPGLEPEAGLPATLSPAMTAGLLRGELGFQGLVFTDALTMQGVAARFTPEEVAVRAVKAGADILLIPVDIEKTAGAVKRAVESGEISRERLDESVRRILEAKARLGLHRQRFADLARLEAEVGALPHQRLARTMIERALTLVRDEKSALPLRLAAGQRLLYINLLDSRRGWAEGVPGRAFRDELLRRHANTVDVQLDDMTSKDAFDVVRKLAGACDAIVVSGFIRVAAYKGSIDLSQWQLELLRDLSKLDKPFVFTLFGSPYLLSFVPQLPAYALAFEDYPEAERAMVRAVFGEIPFTGHLPISLPVASNGEPQSYPIGHGLTTPPPGSSPP